jgi:hypothetical protein
MATKGEDVLMRLWVGISLAAAALAVAGCGGGGGGGEKTTTTTSSSAEAKLVLASAPQKVKEANSSKFSYSITVDSDQLDNPITIPGEGEFDYANKEGRLTMDYGQVLSAAGQSGSGEMEIIAKGSVYYLKWPLLSKSLNASTPWISFDLTKLDQITGFDVSSLRSVNQGDPSQTLVYLKAAGTVEDQGTEDIDGVSTTKYHAVIDLDRIAGLAAADQRAAVRASVVSLKKTYGISELPLDVWIDDQGLPRQLSYEIETTVQGQKVKSSLTMKFSDYGVDVNVEPPPASQVTDLADVA